jgi:hypothetical protein
MEINNILKKHELFPIEVVQETKRNVAGDHGLKIDFRKQTKIYPT